MFVSLFSRDERALNLVHLSIPNRLHHRQRNHRQRSHRHLPIVKYRSRRNPPMFCHLAVLNRTVIPTVKHLTTIRVVLPHRTTTTIGKPKAKQLNQRAQRRNLPQCRQRRIRRVSRKRFLRSLQANLNRKSPALLPSPPRRRRMTRNNRN